jgi:hypothetical protein
MLQLLIAIALGTLAVTLLVAYGYYHREKQCLPGEDYDGDTRNTLLGIMVVMHHRPKSYLRHFLRNFEKYMLLWFSLTLCSLIAAFMWFIGFNRH